MSSPRAAPVVQVVREDHTVLCERCTIAATAFLRMKGLLGRRDLAGDEGLLIGRTSSIHMFFMRFAIDAVFLDRNLVVSKVVPELRPWRIAFGRGAKSVLELRAGEAARRGVSVGERLTLVDRA